MRVSFGTDKTDAALATNWKHFRHRSIKNLVLEFCTVFQEGGKPDSGLSKNLSKQN